MTNVIVVYHANVHCSKGFCSMDRILLTLEFEPPDRDLKSGRNFCDSRTL
jgi:hypothetical protein